MTDNQHTSASLAGAVIELQGSLPRYVIAAAEKLSLVLSHFTGTEISIAHSSNASRPTRDQQSKPIIRVTSANASSLRPSTSEHERYHISASIQDRQLAVIVEAQHPPGAKAGILALIRELIVEPGDARVPLPLSIEREPTFHTRSMYAHLHWTYNSPYALRSWSEAQWQRYATLLTMLGYNTMQLWPMVELIPDPPDAADQHYLAKYRDVIDHLHHELGMQAFVGSCANNITLETRGIPVEQREYFDFETCVNPGDPTQLQRLLQHRATLYRTIDNADGYWVIDADPGGWQGSSSSEFVSILRGHRELLNRFGRDPQHQTLIYWMWESWGTGRIEHNYGRTISELAETLEGPWLIHVCKPEHLHCCMKMGLQHRAIYFPYHLVEDEPSGPFTEIRSNRIMTALQQAGSQQFRAVQANAQTPLVQLPNIHAFAVAGWNPQDSLSQAQMLEDLGKLMAGSQSKRIVRAWQLLSQDDPAACMSAAEDMSRLAADPSGRGVLFPILEDWHQRMIEDLGTMLAIRASVSEFAHRAATKASPAGLADALGHVMRRMSCWLEHTGYHSRRLIMQAHYFDPIFYQLCRLRSEMGEATLQNQVIAPAVEDAASDAASEYVEAVSATLQGLRH